MNINPTEYEYDNMEKNIFKVRIHLFMYDVLR